MTPEQIEFHREKFEEKFGAHSRFENGKYVALFDQYYWQGYLMAIESAFPEVIEQAFMAGQIDAGVDPSYSSAKAYAQSLGLKVKER